MSGVDSVDNRYRVPAVEPVAPVKPLEAPKREDEPQRPPEANKKRKKFSVPSRGAAYDRAGNPVFDTVNLTEDEARERGLDWGNGMEIFDKV